MNAEELKKEYILKRPLFDHLKGESEFIMNKSIASAGIRIHGISGRVKEFDSFFRKIDRGQLVAPFEDITDLVGLRIVCLLRSDIPVIGNIIRRDFDVVSEDNKIEGNEISSFGYQSVHFIVKIKSCYVGPRYDAVKNIVFEIQLRTVAMDAWAIVSHYLDYKTDKDVPFELRKDFYALSGLFYVADTHFEFLYRSSIESKEKSEIRITNKNVLSNEELNLDTFRAYIKRKIVDHEVPKADTRGYSELLNELKFAGYKTIKELDVQVDRGMEAFLKYEKEHPPHFKPGSKYNAIGVIRGLMCIVDDQYRKESQPGMYDKYRYLVKQ